MNESMQEPNEMREWESDFHRWGERPQPEMRPFFYTRLQARLAQSVETAEWLPWWLRQPAYAYSALLLLVLLNIGVVAGAAWWTDKQATTQAATAATGAFLDEYGINPVILAYE
ncbi:hypothetical protein A6C57_04450 [Fibrella sp. ES10-3-2-2]